MSFWEAMGALASTPGWGSATVGKFSKELTLRGRRYRVRYRRRDTRGTMGRFGGGWNWKVGAQLGGSTLLLSLLVAEVTISRVAS